MLARIEEGEQASRRVVAIAFSPCPKAGVGKGKVIFFEYIGLRLRRLGSDDGMVCNYWVLVED